MLRVTGFWAEDGVRWGKGRADRLRLELDRFARLADRRNVRWLKGLAAQGVVSLPESVFSRRGA